MVAVRSSSTENEQAASAAESLEHLREHVRERVRELVRVHHVFVWRFVRRLGLSVALADEVVQEVFLIAFRRFEDIREGSERAFLFATAFRLSRDVLKRNRRETATEAIEEIEPIESSASPAPTPEELLDTKQTCALAYRLLDELDEDLRMILVMFEIEGMALQDIATVTGLPPGTVRSRLRRAREAFQARVDRHRSRLRGAL